MCTHYHVSYQLSNPLQVLITYFLTYKMYTSSFTPSLHSIFYYI
jgi:hypothetical protein